MDNNYQILPELFLRAPFYSFAGYDLDCMPEVLEDECFRNAIWLASPALYNVLLAKDFAFNRMTEKEKLTLYKYYNRMCFRPTPFGSFASFTLLEWGEGGNVRIADNSRSILHLLPDLEFLESRRFRNGLYQNQGRLSLNPTLYRFGREFRFVKSSPGENGRFRFSIEAIEAESLVIQLIAKLKKGLITAGGFIDWLCSKSGSERAAAGEYLDFLIIEQVLFPDQVSGMIGTGHAVTKPENEQEGDFWVHAKNAPVLQVGPLHRFSAELTRLPAAPSLVNPEQCFYAAFERPHDSGGPGQAEKEELLAAVGVLQQLSGTGISPALQQFVSEFSARFDQEKVPLLLATDPDSGIPYANMQSGMADASPLQDIRFPRADQQLVQVEWSTAHRVLFRLLTEARRQNDFGELQLLPNDLDEINPSTSKNGPVTQAVIFRKTADHLLIEYAGGATGTAIVGRFSLFSEKAANLCRNLAEIEISADTGVIFADIDQRSDTHVDNINRRELVYDHFITVNSFSDPGDPASLPLSDLLLYVRNGELVLESKKLGKRVIPRLSTAFNYYHNDLALFRLLCDLQYQGVAPLSVLNLERWFPGMDFYPRIVVGQTILCPAKWKFGEKTISPLSTDKAESVQRRIRRFRQASGIPAKVSLGDFDQQLVFDLTDAQETNFFLHCVSGLKAFTLQEYLPPSRDVKTGKSPVAAQFVAFLTRDAELHLPAFPAGTIENFERDFTPGSEWLYLKVYCTPESADRILATVIYHFVQKQQARIKKWFFIRYDDTGHHLRIRFNAMPADQGILLAAFRILLRRKKQDLLVRNCQVDTYRREIERYGPEFIELAEAVFCAGSTLLCRSLSAYDGSGDRLAEFRRGILTVNALICCFLPEPGGQRIFTALLVSSFTAEFKGEKQLKIDFDRKYRDLKDKIVLPGGGDKGSKAATAVPGLEKLVEDAGLLAAAAKAVPLPAKHRLLADIIHMQMNRNFRSSQRKQEFLVYCFLDKSFRSLAAREAKESTQPGPTC